MEHEVISFACDYLEGCHEEILKALVSTNMEQEPGYGSDRFTKSATRKIREAIQCPDGDVYFLNGGTQTNQLVIDTMLEPYEGVLAADTGHISVHEAGAIEYSGHKVLTLPSHFGKVDVKEAEEYLNTFYEDGNHEHMVYPGMLYISFPTEYGTLYSAEELRALSNLCHRFEIPLFIDGARLGYGLMAEGNDVTLPMIAELSDVFYIGGTKIGALLGEAVVFTKHNTPKHFLTQIKQHGALLAKGRVIALQFDTLFTDDLYWNISRHGITMAMRIRDIFREAGIPFYLESPTNQQFVIVENALLAKLEEKVQYGFWEKYDETHTVIRFASSWATKEEHVDRLQAIIRNLGRDASKGSEE